ncbi:MAG: PIG-L family deacetylase [Nitrosomonadales bacterium]|nr:PIG-L family deacetylase [Nitrosomonadales bacterium]
MKKILVVAVHPDDETLGCGGTLLRHRAAGDEIHWLIVTEAGNDALRQRRTGQIGQVGQAYGFAGIHTLGFPTTRLDQLETGVLVGGIAKIVEAVAPEIIYLPFAYDIHSDHRLVFEAAYSCTKVFRYPSVRRVLMMETPSETDFSPALPGQGFTPNVFVDIADHFDKKMAIAGIYGDEMGAHPFPRSLEGMRALATVRGAAAGCKYAEAFMLLKEIR